MPMMIAALAAPLSVAAGAAVALWMHRRTRLSPRNAYLVWVVCGALAAAAAASRSLPLLGATLIAWVGATTAAVLGRRWRVAALGAGGELREHERSRVMMWTALHDRRAGRASDRVYIAGQGEL